MPISKIRSDYPALQTMAAGFKQEALALRQLQQAQKTLQQGDWMGAGATAFYAEMDGNITPALQRLVTALERAAQVTIQARQIMAQAEQDAAAVFKLSGEGAPPIASNGSASGVTETAPPPPEAHLGTKPPKWLVKKQRPPWIAEETWRHMGMQERQAYVRDVAEKIQQGTFWPPAPRVIPHDQHTGMPNDLGTKNTCGPVALSAAAEALGLETYDVCLNLAGEFATDHGYKVEAGMQPSGYADLARQILPNAKIETPPYADADEALGRIRRELLNGNQVIVDYLSTDQGKGFPKDTPVSGQGFAHFARVVGFSEDGKSIILAQSIWPGDNGSTLAVPIEVFKAAWQDPETRAVHSGDVDEVYNWMMVISKP